MPPANTRLRLRNNTRRNWKSSKEKPRLELGPSFLRLLLPNSLHLERMKKIPFPKRENWMILITNNHNLKLKKKLNKTLLKIK